MTSTGIAKTINRAKAKAEQVRGPARKSTDAAPICDAIEAYHAQDQYPFAIPSHKTRGFDPRVEGLLGQAMRADISVLNGVDNRHQSWQVQSTAQELAAQAFGADQTLFSTGGSTLSVHTALTAVAGPDDEIALARNIHKSAVSGLIHSGSRPVWIEPDYDERLEIAHCVTRDAVAQTLDSHPQVKAVFIVSPTYYGVAADLRTIAEVCHEREVPLATDDAWGAIFPFHPELPPGGMESGVDIALGSGHKTMTSLSQTSFLSVQGERVDIPRLELCLENFQSSSSSAPLLASLDATRRQFVEHGEEMLGGALELARELRATISTIPGLRLLGEEVLLRPGAHGFNPLHVTFDVTGLGLTGYAASDWLRGHCGVAIELADHRRLMALVTVGDDKAAIDRLVAALHALAENHEGGEGDTVGIPPPHELRTETVMSPREAFYSEAQMISIGEAAGEIAAEMVCPYPPGVPIILQGERYTEAIIQYLQAATAAGAMIDGVVDPSLSEVRVVKG
jgi:arginine/lysine/ornithine decarboxylase